MCRFESLAAACRSYLDDESIVYNRLSADFDERKVALRICEFLTTQGFRLAEGEIRNYG